MTSSKSGAFGTYAVDLAKNGFEVLPIRIGDKRPTMDNWTTMELPVAKVKKWAANGHAGYNVGVRTTYTPAVDIDVYDADLAEEMAQWCLDNIGDAPQRQGRAPKVLLVYKTSEAFKKVAIGYEDDEGTVHRIEVLGDGQQFVAYGTHPDTKKPYKWLGATELIDFDEFSLVEITEDDIEALFDAFAEACEARDWTPKGRTALRMSKERHAGEYDDNFDDFKPTLDIETSELAEALEFVPDPDSYDRWLKVGMALHHQFNGDDEGLELWDTFSQRSGSYDRDELEEKWEGFGQYGGSTVTCASILTWATEGREKESKKRIDTALTLIDLCDDADDLLTKKNVKAMMKGIHDALHVEQIEQAVQKKIKELTGSKPRISTIREKLHRGAHGQEKKEGGSNKLPDWCKHYVYVVSDDMFYDMTKHRRVTERGFNAMHNRVLGPMVKESPASRTALDMYHMPTADKYTYAPGEKKLLDVEGATCVNIYNSAGVPDLLDDYSDDDLAAVNRVINHFQLMFPDKRERGLLISFFAYTVQNLNERVNWAPLIYGGFGIGKSFFGQMMRAVLGGSNYIPANASNLKGEFTGWAEGRKLVVFEEIRQNGHERYEVLEKIKPFITNKTIDIRRMRTDSYSVHNVTNYLLFTNHANALPIQKGERRYYVLSPAIKTQAESEALAARDDGRYFELLFNTIEEHASAILTWLTNYKLHKEFKPKGNAPETNDRELMRLLSRDTVEDGLEDFIRGVDLWNVSDDLLLVSALENAADDAGFNLPAMQHNKLGYQLQDLGYHFIGRARLDGKQGRWWSKNPNLVRKDGLQAFINKRSKKHV